MCSGQGRSPDAGGLTGRRALSATIGLLLLLGITVVGTTAVVVFGEAALSDTDEAMNVQQAEHSMTQFDARAAEVALSEAPVNRVSLPKAGVEGGVDVRPDVGWMNITIVNQTTGDVEAVITNRTLGAVVYERTDTEVAYQGGGVWRKVGNDSQMVSPPEFHYRDATLTLPIITVDGSAGGSHVSLRGNGTERVYPGGNASNPLTEGKVVVTVKSEYYDAWGTFFEQRTDGSVSYDHGEHTAEIELITEISEETVDGAIGSTSAGGELRFTGGGSDPMFVDSYNSSVDPYPHSSSWEGTIIAAGDVHIGGNAEIRGDIRTGGRYRQRGTSAVHGDVNWTDTFSVSGGATHNGTDRRISGVESTDPVDALVVGKVENLADPSANDNDAVSVISGNATTGSGTLPAGDYYLERLDVDSGDLLELDTSGGVVTIAVAEDAEVDGTIQVTGGGVARVYVRGESTSGDHFHLDGGQILVPDDRSPQFWLYGQREFQASLDGGGIFQGVVYAPGGPSGSGTVDVRDVDVFGGIVAGTTEIGPNADVHYDQALKDENALPSDANVVRITYLHVTVNEVEVENG